MQNGKLLHTAERDQRQITSFIRRSLPSQHKARPRPLAAFFDKGVKRMETMGTYLFRYADKAGGVVHSTHMQCRGDAAAIEKARGLMGTHARLEIYLSDRLVHTHEAYN